MRIRANNLHLFKPTEPVVICHLNQSPWDAMSSSLLSNNLQIIEADDRYFRDLTSQNSPGERKSIPAKSVPNHKQISAPNYNKSAEKVTKSRPSRGKKKSSKGNSNCNDDDIYNYYSGFGPSKKKRRGVVQNCKEAASTSSFGRKGDNDDDDDAKPLKERSLKSILDDVKSM